MNEIQKRYRVAADFNEQERDALDALCTAQYRPPADVLRFLVMSEARKQGLLAGRKTNGAPVSETHGAAL